MWQFRNTGGGKHTIIDAWQSNYFKNIGVLNLQKAGISNFELIENLSELALPKLLAEGRKFDFCFIDGNHTFDHTLIDFFYLNRMMEVGGVIIFDDAGMPAIKKLLRYILNYPAYQLIGNVNMKTTTKNKMVDWLIKTPLGWISKLLPGKLKHEIFSGKVIISDRKLRLNSSMVAIQKIKHDERNWHWFKDF